VASESTPMSRPLGLTRNKSNTPDKTACPPTRQVPQRYSPGHPGQELTSPPTARCRADIPGSQLAEERHVRELGWDRGLIFGLIHLRSPAFIGVQINGAMQVADVNGIRRTIIPSPENRKVDRSVLSLAVHLHRGVAIGYVCIAPGRDRVVASVLVTYPALGRHAPPGGIQTCKECTQILDRCRR
jgi:hypothetical protein